jgi:ribosomal protein S18 acetylase RimI-like enzyme
MSIVRLAHTGDAETIVSYNMALALETEGMMLDHDTLSLGVARVLMEPTRGTYLVAEDNSGIIGQLMLTWEWSDWRNGMFWWIQSVYVAPASRSQGVFRALFKKAEQLARDSGEACGIRLYVEHENAAAQATYVRLGFHETDYRLMELLFADSD